MYLLVVGVGVLACGGKLAIMWSSRADAVAETLQSLMQAAMMAATDESKNNEPLAAYLVQFDSAAAALEHDLLAAVPESAAPASSRSQSLSLVRALARREEQASSQR